MRLLRHARRAHAGSRSGVALTPEIAALVYELLDAHADTAELAGELTCDPRWAAHLDYLRALQRVGRSALAHDGLEDAA